MCVTFLEENVVLCVLGARGGLPASESFVACENGAGWYESRLRSRSLGQEDWWADVAWVEVGFAVRREVELPVMVEAFGELESSA